MGSTPTSPTKLYKKGVSIIRGSCIVCGRLLDRENQSGYCMGCLREKRKRDKIQKWLETGDANIGVSTTLRGCIREYIFDRQNGRCAICGMNSIWNGYPIKFILDHIDGDASNDQSENLRLICPNCDSQLPTYKSRNKHSARTYRRAT